MPARQGPAVQVLFDAAESQPTVAARPEIKRPILMKRITLLFTGLLFLGAVFHAASAEEFPLRKDFPELKTMSTDELARSVEAGAAVVIDVRSDFEFETIHILGAKHVPLARKTLLSELESFRPKRDERPLVFYCNGTTCAKSYRAAEMAEQAGFDNCFVYDAGVFTWTETQPQLAALMGKTPADPARLISPDALADRMLSFEDFKARAQGPDAVLVDIRDPVQRKVRLDIGEERNIPLDRFNNLLERGDLKDKELLIYDAVGKQVHWLMYHLENSGYTRYAFLDGGVRKAIGDKKHY
jgi:rhodanese-related sulfurtransferase